MLSFNRFFLFKCLFDCSFIINIDIVILYLAVFSNNMEITVGCPLGLNLDSLYTRRLIQQATMFYKIHYNLVDICPPSYIQHANHISSRTDHPLKYCNNNPLQINAYKYSFFPRSMNIWNRLPCSAVSHVMPSVDTFHKFAMPAISVISYEFLFIFYLIFLHIVNNSVLFTSYFYIFLLVVVLLFFALLHSSIA